MLRRINISAAVIVLICFFLPWVQVSCGGVKDALSGFDLAREHSTLLWLVPVLMLAVIAFSLLRAWKDQPKVAAILSAVSGAAAALLMNRERMRAQDSAGLISAQLTGWFWLSVILSATIAVTGAASLLRRRQT